MIGRIGEKLKGTQGRYDRAGMQFSHFLFYWRLDLGYKCLKVINACVYTYLHVLLNIITFLNIRFLSLTQLLLNK